jgi:hypothetical protein
MTKLLEEDENKCRCKITGGYVCTRILQCCDCSIRLLDDLNWILPKAGLTVARPTVGFPEGPLQQFWKVEGLSMKTKY